ncbi:MAG: hypothetical protein IJS14_13540 [Lentisphaeria bacterium]|nr:hypothetical protein [Lentisphaeria bacterium]
MSFPVKIVAAIIIALILIVIAVRLRSKKERGRVLRSLPADMVQAVADRLDDPVELLKYLGSFFDAVYQGAEQPAGDPETLRKLLPAELPEEEFTDLMRTAAAIEPDALLAYACLFPGHEKPAVITVCRGREGGLLVGVFRPE